MAWGALVLPWLLMAQLPPATLPRDGGVGSRYADPAPAADLETFREVAPRADAPVTPVTPPRSTNGTSRNPARSGQIPSTAQSPAVQTPAIQKPVAKPPVEKAPAESSPKAADVALVPVHPAGVEPTAARVLRQALAPPEQEALAGKTVYLADLIASSGPVGAGQRELLEAYWRLSAALAEYHSSLDEHLRLVQIASDQSADEPAWAAALATAFARVQSAKLAAVDAQHDLAQRLGMPADDNLPLPGDRPLVVAYRTFYEELFAQRPTSFHQRRQARRIHDTLPLRLQAINAQAAATEASQTVLEEITAAIADGRGSDAMLLDRHEKLRQQRREFFDAVLHYNLSIAEYALMVAPQGAAPTALLPMLMQNPPTTLSATPAPGVQFTPDAPTLAAPLAVDDSAVVPASAEVPTSAEEPLASSPAEFTPPPVARPLRSVVVPSQGR